MQITNKAASMPAARSIPIQHGYGGVLTAMSELSIHAVGDDYTVEGNGTINSLPAWPTGNIVFLTILGNPTFVNSQKINCQSGANYVGAPGDMVILRSAGDGVWRLYAIPKFRSPIVAPSGRLTLTSGTPIMQASVAGATTVYYTSNTGSNVPIFNGNSIVNVPLAPRNTSGPCEISLALGSSWTANTLYDVFATLDANGVLWLGTGPAWTSLTARGTGAGTTELQQIDGLWTNKNSMTFRNGNASTFTVAPNCATLLGTMMTGLAGQTNFIFGQAASGGVAMNFGICNAYNVEPVGSTVIDNGTSYIYQSFTVRQMRASAGNQAAFVTCLPGRAVNYSLTTSLRLRATAGTSASFNVGFNSNSTFPASIQRYVINQVSAANEFEAGGSVSGQWSAPIGANTLYALESGDAATGNSFAYEQNINLSTVVYC